MNIDWFKPAVVSNPNVSYRFIEVKPDDHEGNEGEDLNYPYSDEFVCQHFVGEADCILVEKTELPGEIGIVSMKKFGVVNDLKKALQNINNPDFPYVWDEDNVVGAVEVLNITVLEVNRKLSKNEATGLVLVSENLWLDTGEDRVIIYSSVNPTQWAVFDLLEYNDEDEHIFEKKWSPCWKD